MFKRRRSLATCELPWYSDYELSVMRAKWERVSHLTEQYIKTNNLSII